ncbi:MAG: hypothetical protein DMF69_09110 [Acidobacteria bacterium]|nr:MAG: hypothetical protein DMF69_09110 [Acidobacteriota bacterium]
MKALLFVSFLLLLLVPASVLACACCSNEGEYYRGLDRIESFQVDLMKEMRFGDKAFLFTSEFDIEDVSKGISKPTDTYALTGSLVNNMWKLIFRDGSNSGIISLPLPLRMEMFKADIHDRQQAPGGGPLLYKEWRFEGRFTGTGIFKPGMFAGTRYSLILQGRGNSCDNSEDFKAWRLVVKGKNADYAFYGEMGKSKQASTAVSKGVVQFGK